MSADQGGASKRGVHARLHGVPRPIILRVKRVDFSPSRTSHEANAAGLLAIGSVYAGSAEDCASLLLELHEQAAASGAEQAAAALVQRYRERGATVPGFGHATHKPDDPRSPKLVQLARDSGLVLRYVPLLEVLGRQIDAAAEKHVTLNATGAIAALLLEIDMPVSAIRGMAVVARAGGLVGHILEERQTGSAKVI